MRNFVQDHQTWERRIDLIASKYFRGCPRPRKNFYTKIFTQKFPDLRYLKLLSRILTINNYGYKTEDEMRVNKSKPLLTVSITGDMYCLTCWSHSASLSGGCIPPCPKNSSPHFIILPNAHKIGELVHMIRPKQYKQTMKNPELVKGYLEEETAAGRVVGPFGDGIGAGCTDQSIWSHSKTPT